MGVRLFSIHTDHDSQSLLHSIHSIVQNHYGSDGVAIENCSSVGLFLWWSDNGHLLGLEHKGLWGPRSKFSSGTERENCAPLMSEFFDVSGMMSVWLYRLSEADVT